MNKHKNNGSRVQIIKILRAQYGEGQPLIFEG